MTHEEVNQQIIDSVKYSGIYLNKRNVMQFVLDLNINWTIGEFDAFFIWFKAQHYRKHYSKLCL